MWLVKLKRTGFETVVGTRDSKAGAELLADELNEHYQTDEYYVERFDDDYAG